MIKAIARAHRWKRLLETGECGSVTEAGRSREDQPVISRKRVAADAGAGHVEAILNERQPAELQVGYAAEAVAGGVERSESGRLAIVG